MPRLGPRLLSGPRLRLNASLQQRLRILACDHDELREVVSAALADNPFLDIADEAPRFAGPEVAPLDPRQDPEEFISLSAWGSEANETDLDDLEAPAPEPSLHAHLAEQITALHLSERDRALAWHLLDHLDERGYLDEAPEELRRSFPGEPTPDETELAAVRHRLQGLDPVGCFSLDLGDCLRAQVQRDSDLDPGTRASLLDLLGLPLADLAHRSDAALGARLGRPATEIARSRRILRRFDPTPGRRGGGSPAVRLVPDLYVEAEGEAWRIRLVEEGIPPIILRRINRNRDPTRTVGDWRRLRDEAHALLRAIGLRRQALLALGTILLERQEAFFRHGTGALRPLRQRALADELGLHESTFSRLIQGKYVLSPQGLHPLKFFFPPVAAVSAEGLEHSPQAVLKVLEEILRNESPVRPYRDNELAELLSQQGIMMARRTVSKYRELHGIPPWHQRRRHPPPNAEESSPR